MTLRLEELLGGKSAASFTAGQLMRKAHWRWYRGQLGAAFMLFDAAWQRAREEGDREREDSARNRAAITLHRSGTDPAGAERRLEEVLGYYEAHPERHRDSHFAEWAGTALIELRFTEDAASFASSFERMRERCARAGCGRYPRIHPQQEQLAAMARRAGAKEVLGALMPVLRSRKPMPRKLRLALAEWERWLAG